MKPVVAEVAMGAALAIPFAWFASLAFIVRPAAWGSVLAGYSAYGSGRVIQGYIYLLAGLAVAILLQRLAARRAQVQGTWFFPARSLGRVIKWLSFCLLSGWLLTVPPAAALVADLATPPPYPPLDVTWATVPWLVALGLSAALGLGTLAIDAVGGALRQAPSERS